MGSNPHGRLGRSLGRSTPRWRGLPRSRRTLVLAECHRMPPVTPMPPHPGPFPEGEGGCFFLLLPPKEGRGDGGMGDGIPDLPSLIPILRPPDPSRKSAPDQSFPPHQFPQACVPGLLTRRRPEGISYWLAKSTSCSTAPGRTRLGSTDPVTIPLQPRTTTGATGGSEHGGGTPGRHGCSVAGGGGRAARRGPVRALVRRGGAAGRRRRRARGRRAQRLLPRVDPGPLRRQPDRGGRGGHGPAAAADASGSTTRPSRRSGT